MKSYTTYCYKFCRTNRSSYLNRAYFVHVTLGRKNLSEPRVLRSYFSLAFKNKRPKIQKIKIQIQGKVLLNGPYFYCNMWLQQFSATFLTIPAILWNTRQYGPVILPTCLVCPKPFVCFEYVAGRSLTIRKCCNISRPALLLFRYAA